MYLTIQKTIDFRNLMIFDENNLLDNNAIISKGYTITNGSPMYLYDKIYNKKLVHLMCIQIKNVNISDFRDLVY
jgi:hypothetical protein